MKIRENKLFLSCLSLLYILYFLFISVHPSISSPHDLADISSYPIGSLVLPALSFVPFFFLIGLVLLRPSSALSSLHLYPSHLFHMHVAYYANGGGSKHL
jgi:hypothetical protein